MGFVAVLIIAIVIGALFGFFSEGNKEGALSGALAGGCLAGDCLSRIFIFGIIIIGIIWLFSFLFG